MKDLKFDINEFFDKEKIEENELDKKRIKENCEFLKSQNIEVLENMLLVPRNFDTFLRSEKYYIAGMLREYLFAVVSASMTGDLENDEKNFCEILDRLIKKYHINEIITKEEYQFLCDMSEGKVTPEIMAQASWKYEKVAVYLSMLGLSDIYELGKVCDAKLIDNYFMFNNNVSLQSLFENAKLKPKEEILKQADLVFRCKWASEQANIDGKCFHMDELVLNEQKKAFSTLLNWDDKMLRRTQVSEK